jgi:hypothetical protein
MNAWLAFSRMHNGDDPTFFAVGSGPRKLTSTKLKSVDALATRLAGRRFDLVFINAGRARSS